MSGEGLDRVRQEIETGIHLDKCQKCGCMREALDRLSAPLPPTSSEASRALTSSIERWNQRMKPMQYACLGCEYCYAAVALNAFSEVFPAGESAPLVCDFQIRKDDSRMVAGEYVILDRTAHVAVSTLASVELADELAARKPRGLAIVGKTETENIGIDKIVKNVIANPSIQYLIVTGKDPSGHLSGQTLLALSAHGVNSDRRVVGSPGKRPILRNVSLDEIGTFRKQVEVIDLIGCGNRDEIIARVEALSPKEPVPCG